MCYQIDSIAQVYFILAKKRPKKTLSKVINFAAESFSVLPKGAQPLHSHTRTRLLAIRQTTKSNNRNNKIIPHIQRSHRRPIDGIAFGRGTNKNQNEWKRFRTIVGIYDCLL